VRVPLPMAEVRAVNQQTACYCLLLLLCMVVFVTVPIVMAEAGLLTIQELSFVAGRIEKPSAGISKDRPSLGHRAATQANLLRTLRIATPSDAI
jgi:hypothetical protein